MSTSSGGSTSDTYNTSHDAVKKKPIVFTIPKVPFAVPAWTAIGILILAILGLIALNLRRSKHEQKVKVAFAEDAKFIKQTLHQHADYDQTHPSWVYHNTKGQTFGVPIQSATLAASKTNVECDLVVSAILPNLMLTGRRGMMQFVKEQHAKNQPVTHVVSLTYTPVEIDPLLVPKANHLRCIIEDAEDANIMSLFSRINTFIRDALDTKNQSPLVVVHCEMGISRSASAVIAFLMDYWDQKTDFIDVLEYVRQRRQYIRPNDGFMKQLDHYQQVRRNNV